MCFLFFEEQFIAGRRTVGAGLLDPVGAGLPDSPQRIPREGSEIREPRFVLTGGCVRRAIFEDYLRYISKFAYNPVDFGLRGHKKTAARFFHQFPGL